MKETDLRRTLGQAPVMDVEEIQAFMNKLDKELPKRKDEKKQELGRVIMMFYMLCAEQHRLTVAWMRKELQDLVGQFEAAKKPRKTRKRT